MATTKIPFRTAYSENILRATPTGRPIIDEYTYTYDDTNRKVLAKTGEKNLYQQIQSHHESTKIENVLARAAIGDFTDFRANGIFADTTGLPTNLIDARKEMLRVENFWNQQPAEVKKKYNWDVDLFMADIGSQAWLINTGLLNPKADENTPAAKAPETTVETPTETK